jgi:hypothetical protein
MTQKVTRDTEQRVFLAYRTIFEGSNALIRKPTPIRRIVDQHRSTTNSLLQSIGTEQVIEILKSLLARRIFQNSLQARLAFPELYATSATHQQIRNASQADAARSELEALEEIASLEDGHEGWDDEPVSAPAKEISNHASGFLGTAVPVLKAESQVPRVVKDSNGSSVKQNAVAPSFYPIYFPYRTQHMILTTAQGLLEECCYEFSLRWIPDLLEEKKWDCPEAIELNKWTYIVIRLAGTLPKDCFAYFPPGNIAGPSTINSKPLAETLIAVNKLRHSAVHRLHTTVQGLLEMIRSAGEFAKALQDGFREQLFGELAAEVESKMKALELNKNFLERRIERELDEIARLRRELDQREKDAIAAARKEDSEQVQLVGGLLAKAADRILVHRDELNFEDGEEAAEDDNEVDSEEDESDKGGDTKEVQTASNKTVPVPELPEVKPDGERQVNGDTTNRSPR